MHHLSQRSTRRLTPLRNLPTHTSRLLPSLALQNGSRRNVEVAETIRLPSPTTHAVRLREMITTRKRHQQRIKLLYLKALKPFLTIDDPQKIPKLLGCFRGRLTWAMNFLTAYRDLLAELDLKKGNISDVLLFMSRMRDLGFTDDKELITCLKTCLTELYMQKGSLSPKDLSLFPEFLFVLKDSARDISTLKKYIGQYGPSLERHALNKVISAIRQLKEKNIEQNFEIAYILNKYSKYCQEKGLNFADVPEALFALGFQQASDHLILLHRLSQFHIHTGYAPLDQIPLIVAHYRAKGIDNYEHMVSELQREGLPRELRAHT